MKRLCSFLLALLALTVLTVPAGAEELQYRRMWRKFYDTIAIAGRENPKCRMSHMPKRYWDNMTEFQREEPPALSKP